MVYQRPDVLSRNPDRSLSVVQLQRQLSEERVESTASIRETVVRDYERLRPRFRELSECSKLLFAEPRLGRDGLAPLYRLATEGLSLSKLVHRELSKVDLPRERLAPTEIVDQLIDANFQILDRLENQLWLLDSTVEYADQLHIAVEELLHTKRVSPIRLQDLTQRLILDVRETPTSDGLIPLAGLSLRDLLPTHKRQADRFVYADGIQTARLLVWTLHHASIGAHRLEVLAMAALLQDTGVLVLESARRATLRSQSLDALREDNRHPAIGAALASGVRKYSVDLPLLIGQHHERLNGSGYPNKTRSRRMSRESRLLGIVNRMVELMQQSSPTEISSTGDSHSTNPCPTAATQLYRETLQGEFDLELTAELLRRFDLASIPDKIQTEQATPRFESGRYRRHATHGTQQRPHRGHASAGTAARSTTMFSRERQNR